MIGILLHKRGHRVLDGSEPKVDTKRIEFISEAAFLFFFASVSPWDFITIAGVYEFFATSQKSPT